MSDWMAAADAMIHATAGLTVLEAHIRGCPVVSYGFSAGHLRANNAAFERFGLAEVARSKHELESVLRHVTRERRSPDSSFASLPSIASRVLTVRPRVRPQPVWRLRTERVATAVALALIAVVMLFTVIDREAPYKVVAKPLEGRIHFGKDNDTPAPGRRKLQAGAAGPGGRQAGAAPAAGIDRGAARRRRLGAPRSLHAGPALAPVVPAIGPALRHRADARTGRTASPSPSTTARTRRAPRRCWRPCASAGRRRPSSSPASRWRGGRRWSAEIVAAGHRVELHCHRHRNLLRLSPRALARRRRAGAGGDRGGERPGDLRLPPALRDLQRRRPAGRARPRLAAGALVALGARLDARRDRRVDRASLERRHPGRRHPAPARCRLLQRAAAPGSAPRRRCR